MLILGNSWREKPNEEALALAESARSFAGISRVSRIDGLTGLDIPIFSVTRPQSRTAITLTSGKGTTVEESRLSGLFEAIEIAAAEINLAEMVTSLPALRASRIPHVDFERLCAAPTDLVIPWTKTREFTTGEEVWAPASAVGMLPVEGVFLPTSNGLASGLSFNEALFHALLEILERHAYSLALVHRAGVSVDLASLNDPFLNSVTAKGQTQDLKIESKDLSEWIGIPCFYSLFFSENEEDSHLIGGGIGCHLDPVIALRRAVTEAVQSRAAAISGAREDLTESERRRGKDFESTRDLFRFWYEPTPQLKKLTPLSEIPKDMNEAIQWTLSRARAADPSLGRFLYRELPAPPGIHVVRAILENAELFGLQRDRIGARIRKVLDA